jgi:hypothetical protein
MKKESEKRGKVSKKRKRGKKKKKGERDNGK